MIAYAIRDGIPFSAKDATPTRLIIESELFLACFNS